MISIIAERYNIHPQTLRLYEREGLIKPVRTSGNTRLYGQDEIKKLELILTLTRKWCCNWPG
jgi:MerR family transcriptional regulator, heat shock protein HspR